MDEVLDLKIKYLNAHLNDLHRVYVQMRNLEPLNQDLPSHIIIRSLLRDIERMMRDVDNTSEYYVSERDQLDKEMDDNG